MGFLQQQVRGGLIAVVLLLGVVCPAFAAISPTVSGSQMRDFTRITFNWPENVRFKVQPTGQGVVLTFNQPANINLAALRAAMGNHLKNATASADGTTLTLGFDQPYRVRHFISGNANGIDVLGATSTAQAAPPTAPVPHAAVAPAVPKPPTPPPAKVKPATPVKAATPVSSPAAANPAQKAPAPKPENTAPAQAKQQTEPAALKPVAKEPAAAKAKATVKKALPTAEPSPPAPSQEPEAVPVSEAEKPPLVSSTPEKPAPKAQAESPPQSEPAPPAKAAQPESPPPPATAEKTETPATEPQPAAAATSPAAAEAPAPSADAAKAEATPENPATPEASPQPPAAGTPDPFSPPASSVEAATEKEQPEAPLPPPAQAASTTATGPFIVTSNVLPTGTEIRFPWRTRTAAAVFFRGTTLWIVFDAKFEVKPELLKSIMPAAVEKIELVEHPTYTVLRLNTDGTIYAKVTRPQASLEWWITLSHYRQLPKLALPINPNAEAKTPSLTLPILEYAAPITITDPIVGDELVIAPFFIVGQGVYPARSYPELTLLETAQGLAMVRKADLAMVYPLRNGLKVTAKNGISLSRNLPQLALEELESMTAESTLWFPYDNWKAEEGSFNAKRQELEKQLIGAADIRANSLRLKLAQLYLAEGLAYETLGWLDVIRASDPNFYTERQLAAMNGAANFLIDRYEAATADFKSPELNDRPEQTLWLDALRILQEDRPRFNYVDYFPAYIKKYPPALREKLAILAADNYINRRSFAKALATFDTLSETGIAPRLMPYVDFLLGKISAESKKYKTAEALWKPLTEQLDDRFIRARADFALTTMHYTHGDITLKDAIKRLDKLRVVWRGDSLELSLLNYLGQLYIKDSNFLEGLRVLKELKNQFPTSPILPDVAVLMASTFKHLFAEGEADKLEPLQALSIFYEFRDLVPIGDEGDSMIQGLATRLAGVDLLDKAAALLEHQIKFRQEKLARSKLGAQLAMIYLLNKEPQKALNTLEVTGYGDNPPALQEERTQLAATALLELGQPEKAIEMLAPDLSRNADLLRLNIFWKMREWPEVIRVAESMLSARSDATKPLNEQETGQLLQLAIAYMFERDTAQLNYLRNFFEPLLPKGTSKEIFMFVTDASGPIDPKKMQEVTNQMSRIKGFMETYRKRVSENSAAATEPAATTN